MDFRARLRRAFPYLVIGIGGFALAYLIVFFFVIPSKIVPPKHVAFTGDTSSVLTPIDTTVMPQDTTTPLDAIRSDTIASAEARQPIPTPDLVGMELPDARGLLDGYRLLTAVKHDTSSIQPPNTVLSQTPATGLPIAPGGTVTLTVSYFPPDSSADSSSQVRPYGSFGRVMPADTTAARSRADSSRTRRDSTGRPRSASRDTSHTPADTTSQRQQ